MNGCSSSIYEHGLNTMIDKEQIESLVCEVVKEIFDDFGLSNGGDIKSQTLLFGTNSSVTSIILVAIISEVEARIYEEFDLTLILADERAMSAKRSPFRRISTMVDYIIDLELAK